jgi:hypothetical protein
MKPVLKAVQKKLANNIKIEKDMILNKKKHETKSKKQIAVLKNASQNYDNNLDQTIRDLSTFNIDDMSSALNDTIEEISKIDLNKITVQPILQTKSDTSQFIQLPRQVATQQIPQNISLTASPFLQPKLFITQPIPLQRPSTTYSYRVHGLLLDNIDMESIRIPIDIISDFRTYWLTDSIIQAFFLCFSAEKKVYVMDNNHMRQILENGRLNNHTRTVSHLSLFSYLYAYKIVFNPNIITR